MLQALYNQLSAIGKSILIVFKIKVLNVFSMENCYQGGGTRGGFQSKIKLFRQRNHNFSCFIFVFSPEFGTSRPISVKIQNVE